jgi:hypothetical protein
MLVGGARYLPPDPGGGLLLGARMESDLDGTGPLGRFEPFRVFCPQCGADSDAEDHVFGIGNLAHVPQSDFLLLQVRCETCGIQFDTGLLMGDGHANMQFPL